MPARHHRGSRAKARRLTVADRGNARIQRFTLDGKHIDFVSGTNMPCHFNFFKNGDVVVPDLGARVTLLDKQNKVIAHLGDDSESKWRDTRKLSRDHFTPGKFVARTAPASTTKAISSWWSGWKSAASPNCATSDLRSLRSRL